MRVDPFGPVRACLYALGGFRDLWESLGFGVVLVFWDALEHFGIYLHGFVDVCYQLPWVQIMKQVRELYTKAIVRLSTCAINHHIRFLFVLQFLFNR